MGSASGSGAELSPPRAAALRADHSVLVVLLVLTGALRLAFPGDVPFIADEPLLVEGALDALEDGTFVTSGLLGTRGATYGPFPTWFYQIALLLTSDLRWIALGKVISITLVSGWAVSRLARSTPGLVAPLGAFAFLSPYLWFYARDLWDNSFAIPLTAGLLASYVAYLESYRLRRLAATGIFATLALMTHFMTAPLVLAIGVHFVATRWRAVIGSAREAAGVAGITLGCALLALPYLTQVRADAATNLLWSPSPRSLLFALDGFRVLSVAGFDYVIGAWSLSGAAPWIVGVSCLSYAAGVYGVGLALLDDRGAPSHRREVARVLLLALVFFVLLANGKRLSEHPHYYNGVWIVFFGFWWIGMSRLVENVWGRRLFAAQSIVMLAFLVGVAGWLHQNRGTRSLHYGPTLANQMDVAATLESVGAVDAPPSAAHHPRLFPQAIRVLRRLEVRKDGAVRLSAADEALDYEIVYVDPAGPSGEIAVRALPPPGDGSSGSEPDSPRP